LISGSQSTSGDFSSCDAIECAQGILVEASVRNFKAMSATRPAAMRVHAAACNASTTVHFLESGAR